MVITHKQQTSRRVSTDDYLATFLKPGEEVSIKGTKFIDKKFITALKTPNEPSISMGRGKIFGFLQPFLYGMPIMNAVVALILAFVYIYNTPVPNRIVGFVPLACIIFIVFMYLFPVRQFRRLLKGRKVFL